MTRSWYNTLSMKGMSRMRDERGMVSFTVTLIMILVITLIVLGFSQVTRRNVREALDRQLSSQAFYAAESGINVTATKLANYVAANGSSNLGDKKSCTNGAGDSTEYDPGDASGQGLAINDLSTTNGVRYTCVLVNPHPPTLIYDISQDGSTVAPITSTGNIKTLKFQWFKEAKTTDTSCAGATSYVFPPLASWTCGYGVVRIDLVAIPTGATFTSANLANNTVTIFLTPHGAGGGTASIANYTSKKAYIVSGSGCGTGTCQAVITLPGDSANYYARLISTYRNAANTTISGTLVGGGTATFIGSQAVVDVTGQAQDELRRVQARVALMPTADDIPQSALSSSADVCKRFSIIPTDNVTLNDLCQ